MVKWTGNEWGILKNALIRCEILNNYVILRWR